MQLIDRFLNSITMYRLTLYVLTAFVGIAVILSFLGILQYNPFDIIIASLVSVVFSYIANHVFARFFNAVTNTESVFITALILVLIFPVKFPQGTAVLAVASIFAMGVKYLPTIDKRHIFNPAAAAAAGLGLLSPEHSATWWVGTPAMFVFVLVGGLLLVRKTRRENMAFTFLVVYLIIISISSFLHGGSVTNVITTLKISTLQSALFFFTFVMLTEPLTSPPTEKLQQWYSVVVALLYATVPLRLSFALTPEEALSLGNMFSYIVSPKYRLILPLKQKVQIAADTFAFIFQNPGKFSFVPGQYMEWTLPHQHTDNRGNRRYFSIASSPTEGDIMIAVRHYNPSSSFKNALYNLPQSKEVIATHLAGDFVLPQHLNQPIVFIAGGIGIAPFRSMIQYIIDKHVRADIVLMYANRNVADIAFSNTFTQAAANGVKTVYVLTDPQAVPQGWQGGVGHIDSDTVQRFIPNYQNRIYYISGPDPMVRTTQKILHNMGIPSKHIITDYFPGYQEK